MSDEHEVPTTTELLNMLHDQIDTIDRVIVYVDIKFKYEQTYTYYRMNMN
jgi:hypothetical protein